MSIGLISSVLVFSQANQAEATNIVGCSQNSDCEQFTNECATWVCDGICSPSGGLGILSQGTPCDDNDSCTTGGTCSGPGTPSQHVGICEGIEPITSPICNGGATIGGEMIHMETSALLLAGMQSSLTWLVPSLASAAVAGIILYRIKRM